MIARPGEQDVDLTLEDMLEVLIPMGFPTFDEFRKNPDKWRESKSSFFESIDRSMVHDRKNLAKQKIYWRYGKEAFTLEKLEGVCKDNGYEIDQVDMLPFRMKNSSGTGKDEVLVRVFPKHELKSMGAVIPT